MLVTFLASCQKFEEDTQAVHLRTKKSRLCRIAWNEVLNQELVYKDTENFGLATLKSFSFEFDRSGKFKYVFDLYDEEIKNNYRGFFQFADSVGEGTWSFEGSGKSTNLVVNIENHKVVFDLLALDPKTMKIQWTSENGKIVETMMIMNR